MIRRTTGAAAALCLLLSGCGASSSPSQTLSSPSPTGGSCTASGSGTTDLKTKPVVTAPSDPAPTTTTTTDIVCGTGAQAEDGSKVQVRYLGALYKDGKEFDSSWSRGYSDLLPVTVGSGVIPGFSTGLKGMRVGGRRQVLIPAAEGYGAQGSPPAIPPNADLIFVIDLVSVQPPPSRTPCTPSGTGTTDLKKKPVVVPPTTPVGPKTTFVDIVCGTGAQADDGSRVQVRYLGVLYKGGKEFDSSWSRGYDDLFPFTVGGGVIPGFTTGVTGMKVGGRREIHIPAAEGYGAQGSPPAIPPNADLIFVIDLVAVE